ncbi:hypothetical protein C0992_008609, partial [Termitomyces sp. T32_za158]
MVYISKSQGMEALLKWVDDFIFFRYLHRDANGEAYYKYSKDLIWSTAEELGWLWAPDKFMPFADHFTYIGFEWSLVHKTVSLPHAKKEKYLRKLEAWTLGESVTLQMMESLIGTLNHVTLV